MSVTDAAVTVEPPRPTGGVDWATDDHAVAVVGPEGEQTLRFSIAHDASGLRSMIKRLLGAGVAEVGIERPDGPIVDAPRAAGLIVYLIPPGQLKNLRSRSGRGRAARLLAEIRDARGRFPTADSLACPAGVAPSTRQSGKVEVVSFRWDADKQLRDALCDFAGDSPHANPGAADLHHRARNRGHDHPHAVRILAPAWVDIIWACWTTHTPDDDPDRHGALQRILNHDQQTAA